MISYTTCSHFCPHLITILHDYLVCNALSYSFENASELVCLSSLSDNVADICKLNVNAYVLDGAVIVQMVQPGCNKPLTSTGRKYFCRTYRRY